MTAAGPALAEGQLNPNEGVPPAVRDLDAADDAVWFTPHRQRLFRARVGDGGTWIVRCRRQADGPDVLLRTFFRASVDRDTDGELALLWFASAFPGWSPEQLRKAARRAIQRDRG